MNLNTLVEKLGELGLVWPDAVSAAASLGRGMTTQERVAWTRLVRRTYGAQALKAGFALFGRELELRHLTALHGQEQAWLERVRQTPALARLLRAFLLVGASPPADIGSIRAGVLQRGLTPGTWKWLCRQRPAFVGKLFRFGWTEEAIFWANLLARARGDRPLCAKWLEAGRPYMLDQHYQRLKAGTGDALRKNTQNLERFFRLLPSAPTAEMLQQYELIAAGLIVSMQDKRWPLDVLPNATWKGLLARLRAYNEERERQAQERRQQLQQEAQEAQEAEEALEKASWKPTFGTLTAAGVQARELVSNADLVEEGQLLDHCVGNGAYLHGCLAGEHIIVSLEEPHTKARATLQLRYSPQTGKYLIAQLAGPGNSNVPQVFWKAAKTVQAHVEAH